MSSSTFLSFLLRRSPTFFFNRTARCLSCHHSSPLLFSSPQFSFLSSSLPSPSSFPLSSFTPSFQKSLFSQNLLPTPCPSQNLSKQIFLSTNPQKDIFQTHPFHFIAKLIGVPIPSLSGSLSSPSSLATTHHHRISKKVIPFLDPKILFLQLQELLYSLQAPTNFSSSSFSPFQNSNNKRHQILLQSMELFLQAYLSAEIRGEVSVQLLETGRDLLKLVLRDTFISPYYERRPGSLFHHKLITIGGIVSIEIAQMAPRGYRKSLKILKDFQKTYPSPLDHKPILDCAIFSSLSSAASFNALPLIEKMDKPIDENTCGAIVSGISICGDPSQSQLLNSPTITSSTTFPTESPAQSLLSSQKIPFLALATVAKFCAIRNHKEGVQELNKIVQDHLANLEKTDLHQFKENRSRFWSALLGGCAVAHNITGAKEVFSGMLSSSVPPQLEDLKDFLDAFSDLPSTLHDAQQILSSILDMSLSLSQREREKCVASVLGASLTSRFSLWAPLISSHLASHPLQFQSEDKDVILSSFLKGNVEDILQTLQKEIILTNSIFSLLLVHSFIRVGDVESALLLLEERKEKIMEDERTEIWERAKISERETEREGERQKKSEWGEDEWMALFFCQEKRGRHDLALDIALQAKKRDAFLPHDWLLQLFSQFKETKQVNKCLQTLDLLKTDSPSLSLPLDLYHHLTTDSDFEGAKKVWEWMSDQSLIPPPLSSISLKRSAKDHKEEEREEEGEREGKDFFQQIESVIETLDECGDEKAIEHLFSFYNEEISDESIPLWVAKGRYLCNKSPQQTLRIFHSLSETNSLTPSLFLSALYSLFSLEDGERALSLLQKMEELQRKKEPHFLVKEQKQRELLTEGEHEEVMREDGEGWGTAVTEGRRLYAEWLIKRGKMKECLDFFGEREDQLRNRMPISFWNLWRTTSHYYRFVPSPLDDYSFPSLPSKFSPSLVFPQLNCQSPSEFALPSDVTTDRVLEDATTFFSITKREGKKKKKEQLKEIAESKFSNFTKKHLTEDDFLYLSYLSLEHQRRERAAQGDREEREEGSQGLFPTLVSVEKAKVIVLDHIVQHPERYTKEGDFVKIETLREILDYFGVRYSLHDRKKKLFQLAVQSIQQQ